MLIERQRVKGVLYVRSEVGILKLIKLGEHVPEMARYAQRTHGVRYSNAFYWYDYITIWEMRPNVWLPGVSSQTIALP